MQKPLSDVWAQIQKIEVVYDDEDLVAVYKPSGILVHQSQGLKEPTLAGWVKKRFGLFAAHPLFRLDRGTSGLVLFAKTPELARLLNENPPRKSYLLAVRGKAPSRGVIGHPVLNRRETEKVAAETRFRRWRVFVLDGQTFSWVVARPKTGRMHQIRRHFKHISHPLVGDVKYGKGAINRLFREATGVHRLMLHARKITVVHPVTGCRRTLTVPWPQDEWGALEAQAQ